MTVDKLAKEIIKTIKEADKRNTSAYDTTAKVLRVKDNTAWVHIPGGVEETPIKRTIDCKAGDTVNIRIGGGSAWITGNSTAPPTDDTTAQQAVKQAGIISKVVSTIKTQVEKIGQIAGNTAQYFWHTETGTDTGVHITEIPQDEFLADPENGGGNLLARSNGIAVRDGLSELARFSADGAQIGTDEDFHAKVLPDSFSMDKGDEVLFHVYSSGDKTFMNLGEEGKALYVPYTNTEVEELVAYFESDCTVEENQGTYWLVDWEQHVSYLIDDVATSGSDKYGHVLNHNDEDISSSRFEYVKCYVAGTQSGTIEKIERAVPLPEVPYNPGSIAMGGTEMHGEDGRLTVSTEDGEYHNGDFYIYGTEEQNGDLTVGGDIDCNGFMGCDEIGAGNLYSGTDEGVVVSANSYKDIDIDFNHTFPRPPVVVACFFSLSTAGSFGLCTLSVHTVTTTQCTVRIFNGDSTQRSPGIRWIAFTPRW